MTVKELRDWLAQFPDDMEVIETRYSDYGPMDIGSWGVVDAIERQQGAYFMRAHQTISDDERAKAEKFVHYAGN